MPAVHPDEEPPVVVADIEALLNGDLSPIDRSVFRELLRGLEALIPGPAGLRVRNARLAEELPIVEEDIRSAVLRDSDDAPLVVDVRLQARVEAINRELVFLDEGPEVEE